METSKRGELFGYAGCEGGSGGVFDVSKQVFDTDFFCFFCFDCRGDVQESFACFCAVLYLGY